MGWHSIHVAYHDRQDPLILQAVQPLFRRLAGQVDTAFYTRHWRRGPHLRLNVRTDAATFTHVVWPAAVEVVGGYLEARPSTRRLDPEKLAPMHQRLAELEDERGPLSPWYPDNTIHRAAYDSRAHVLGGPDVADLIGDYHASTTEIAFGMTEQIARGVPRLALAFDLMVTTISALSGMPVTHGCIALRSHAEAFLHAWPEGTGLRPAWDDHYRRHPAALAERLGAVIAGLQDQPRGPRLLHDWVATLTPYRERAMGLITELKQSPSWDDTAGLDLATISPFHQELTARPSWREVQSSSAFAVYRLILNLLYLHLTRLGVTPVERFLTCHLVANTVEDVHGVSARELVKQPAVLPRW